MDNATLKTNFLKCGCADCIAGVRLIEENDRLIEILGRTDGWVLLPKEPTEAMLSHVAGTDFRALSPSKQAAERLAYANMLAAVPARNSDKGVGS